MDTPLKQLVSELVPRWAKDVLGFRSFLRQQKQLLSHPAITLSVHYPSRGQRSALGFLMLGMGFAVVCFLMPSLVAGAILSPQKHEAGPTPWELNEEAQALQNKILKDDAFDKTEDNRILAQIKKDALDAYIAEFGMKKEGLYLIAIPISVVISSYIFSVLIRWQRREAGSFLKIANGYILLQSAALFWPIAVSAFCDGGDEAIRKFIWPDKFGNVISWIFFWGGIAILFIGIGAWIWASVLVAKAVNFKLQRRLHFVRVIISCCVSWTIGTALALGLCVGGSYVVVNLVEAIDRWKLGRG